MYRVSALLACLGVASAFAPAALLPRATSRAAVSKVGGLRMQEDLAIPFLEKPENLDKSMPGYAGFDPLGFSNSYDIKWLQESEIKHGRVCMLGVVGLILPEFFHLPMYESGTTVYDNAFTVPGVALVQIFLGLGALELKMHGGKIGRNDMFDGDRAPGDFGFDPMGLGKKDISTLKLKEIKNGRLAMLAFSGIMHQQIISKVPTMVFGGPWGQTPTPFVISPLN